MSEQPRRPILTGTSIHLMIHGEIQHIDVPENEVKASHAH